MKSPKTTWAGILAFLALAATQAGYLVDSDPTTTINIPVIITAFWALIQGVISRDNDKTSEQVGAK